MLLLPPRQSGIHQLGLQSAFDEQMIDLYELIAKILIINAGINGGKSWTKIGLYGYHVLVLLRCFYISTEYNTPISGIGAKLALYVRNFYSPSP